MTVISLEAKADVVPPAGDLTRLLAEWAANLSYDDIPERVRAHIRLCLLDTLGCGLYGSRQESGQIAGRVAQRIGSGPALVWSHGARSDIASAAMANGTAVHSFEIDDVHLSGQIHPGSVTVPAVMALADQLATEGLASSGEQMIVALVAGYEVGIRIGVAAGRGHGLSGFHPTGTIGAIAAAISAARFLGLDANTMRNAIALGSTQAGGLYSTRTGGMTKRFHAGRAASSGVLSALMAQEGFTGAQDVLEASFGGFLSSFGCDGSIQNAIAGLGEEWLCADVGFKVFSTCASAQTIVEGIQQLRAKGLTAECLQRLDVYSSSISVSNVGWRYVPADLVAAQMNGGYAAAVTLLEGDAFVVQYDDAHLVDPAIVELAGKVHFHIDPLIEAGGLGLRHASRVVATLTDGRTLETYNEQRLGGPGRAIPADRIEQKFLNLAAAACSADKAERIRDAALGLQELDNVTALSRLIAE